MPKIYKKVDFTLNTNVQFVYDRALQILTIKTDNGQNLEINLGQSNTPTIILNDDGNLVIDQVQNVADVNFAPTLHHIQRIYGQTDQERILLTDGLIELTQGGTTYTKDISMIDDKIEFTLQGAASGITTSFQLNEAGLSYSDATGTYHILNSGDTYSEFNPSSNKVATMLDVYNSATPSIGSTTSAFTNPTSGVDNTFPISSITMTIGTLQVGTTIYATNGGGIVMRLDDTNAVVRFISSYQADLGPLAVAQSVELTSDLVTGQLTITLTDVDGHIGSSVTPIGGSGQYMHTFDIETNDDNYRISSTYILFAGTNTPLFTDSSTFLTWLGSSNPVLDGLGGTATIKNPLDYDVDMSSIQNFISYEIDHVQMSTDFIPSFTSGSCYVQLTDGTEFGFDQDTGVVYVSPNYTDQKFTIGDANGFASSFGDKGFEGNYDTRTLQFVDFQSVAFVFGTFKYTGKFTAELINPYKDGTPTEIAGISSSNRGQGTIAPTDPDYDPIVYQTSSLSPCIDGVSSTPSPGVNNYDALLNKPFGYAHQALENYINSIKTTANNANKKAKAALGLATTAEAGVAQLEAIVYSPVPLGPVGPHKGLFGLIPEMQVDMAQLHTDLWSLNGEVARLQDDLAGYERREGTINIENVGSDPNTGIGYGLTLTDNPLGTGPKHYYKISMNKAGTGVQGGPEYPIRANQVPTGLKDESQVFKFNRFDNLHETIMTMQYQPNHLDIDANGLRLNHSIVMDEPLAMLGNNMTVNGHRSQLQLNDAGGALETARATTRAAQLRQDDMGLYIRGLNPNTTYMFSYDQGLDMNGKQIHNVADGTAPQDVATVNQLNQIEGREFDEFKGIEILSNNRCVIRLNNDHHGNVWAVTSEQPDVFFAGVYNAVNKETVYTLNGVQTSTQIYLVNSQTQFRPDTILKTISWGDYSNLRNTPIKHDSPTTDSGVIQDKTVIQATPQAITMQTNNSPIMLLTEHTTTILTDVDMQLKRITNMDMGANPDDEDAANVGYVKEGINGVTNGGLNGWKIMVVDAMPAIPDADTIYFVRGS